MALLLRWARVDATMSAHSRASGNPAWILVQKIFFMISAA
jgi:hypothetical protein